VYQFLHPQEDLSSEHMQHPHQLAPISLIHKSPRVGITSSSIERAGLSIAERAMATLWQSNAKQIYAEQSKATQSKPR